MSRLCFQGLSMLYQVSELNSFLRLNNFMIGMYNILCIHSPVNKHLDCSHLISIVNSAVVNIGKQISVQDCAFSLLSTFLVVELLGYILILCSIF